MTSANTQPGDRPAMPVGFPDVQHIWVRYPHDVRLPVQEVEEIFNGKRRFGMRHPPYRSEEVFHK